MLSFTSKDVFQTFFDGGRSCAVAGRYGREESRVNQTDRMLTTEKLRTLVDEGRVDTVLLAMTDLQGRLQGKRLWAPYFVDEVMTEGSGACSYILATDVEMNTVDGFALTGWERGYGDVVLQPDLATLRLVPWLEGTALVLCDVTWEDGSAVRPSPRQVLDEQLARL